MKAWLLRVLAVGAAILMLFGNGLPAGATTSAAAPAAAMPVAMAAGAAAQTAGAAEQAAGASVQAAGVAERAAGVAEQAAGVAVQTAGVAERAAGGAEQAAGVSEQAAGVAEGAAEPQAEGKTAVIAVYEDPVRGGWTHTTVHPEPGAIAAVAEGFRRAGAEVIVGDFSTERDTAFFWSGLGAGGEDRAAAMASERDGVTLGMLLEERDIAMPTWDGSEKIEEAWAAVSEEFARQASGTVRVILGPHVRPNAIWYTEFANLKRNPQVTRVIAIDSETGEESTIYVRGQQRAG